MTFPISFLVLKPESEEKVYGKFSHTVRRVDENNYVEFFAVYTMSDGGVRMLSEIDIARLQRLKFIS